MSHSCFRFRENIIIPSNLGPVKIKTNEEKMIESVMESCFFKSFMACVLGKSCNLSGNLSKRCAYINIATFFSFFYIGYGLGAAIGLFSSSVNPNIATPGVVEKQQTARQVFREMRSTTHGYAKNFALIGMVFSAVECTIETV